MVFSQIFDQFHRASPAVCKCLTVQRPADLQAFEICLLKPAVGVAGRFASFSTGHMLASICKQKPYCSWWKI
jgi:hypothetical protein